uniref:phenylalanyl tRNA synthetase beta subunit n=1 Tax=Phaeostrophion irregulare TaxID=243268 RepID=UPI002E78F5B8|nr:phenylalanyl tRNA synthetase beta subunit [Phaeostrophion irregulare]WAM64382.1 phenylalanyl tRNA synthetase beta subunit [Phaeostrophion irregulare]
MYLSLKWIEDLLGIQALPLSHLLDRLTLAGFEIEKIHHKKIFKNKYLRLQIDLTANRADVSNFKGFFGEILSLMKTDLFLQTPSRIKPLVLFSPKQKILTYVNFFYHSDLNYELQSKSNNLHFSNKFHFFLFSYSIWEYYLQKKYFSKIIKNYKNFNYLNSNAYLSIIEVKSEKTVVKESPYWIKKRLLLNNFQITNNIIDTINYVMLETGQVFFAYDLKSLKTLAKTSNLQFISKYANNTDLFPISELNKINLNTTTLTFTINNKIVSIAGLLQNFYTLVNKNTSEFVIRGGLYNANKIKKSAKTLGIRTEYSTRLEKQVDLNSLEQSYLRLIHLFWVQNIKFHDLRSQDLLTFQKNDHSFFINYIRLGQKRIKIFFHNIKRLIGPYKDYQNLDKLHVIKNLKFLNFKISYKTDQSCYLRVPLPRQLDIDREVDIIEEIVRNLGFAKFNSRLPKLNPFGTITKIEKFKRRLKFYFLNFGFNESLHSILVKKAPFYGAKLNNPLFTDSSILRLSLLNELIKKVKINRKKVSYPFETFEVGRAYKQLSNGNNKEIELITGVFGGKRFRDSWESKGSGINWFEAKGLLEDIFSKLNLSVVWMQANFKNSTSFHPNRTTNLIIGEQIIGTFGQIHPRLVLKSPLVKKMYLFELNIDLLNRLWKNKTSINYIPYSFYPTSYIDLSCVVNKSSNFYQIKQQIYTVGQPLLHSIELFDYYSKPPIEKNYCSLSFKLRFKSKVRTLVSSEITDIIKLIIINLERKFDIKFQQ